MRRRCSDMCMSNRRRMLASRDQASDVRDIGEEIRANFVSNLPEFGEIDGSAVGTGTGNDRLRFHFLGHATHFVVLDQARLSIDTVEVRLKEPTGEVNILAVREMAAFAEIHTQNAVARIKQAEERSKIGTRTTVWLHVGIGCAEERGHALDGDVLYDIDKLTTAVIALTGEALGVLVCKNRANSGENSRAHIVLRSNEFNPLLLALLFLLNCGCHIWIGLHKHVEIHHVPGSWYGIDSRKCSLYLTRYRWQCTILSNEIFGSGGVSVRQIGGATMRVLVTGGGGYIGSVAIERLRDHGHDVVALDSLVRGHRGAIPEDVELVEADLRNPSETAEAVKAANPDAIMHFAALHLVPESVSDPGAYYQTNVGGGINLLCAARDFGVTKFVFSSTAAVYGEPKSLPVKEDEPKEPINPYGHSKYMVEQFFPAFEREHGINWAAFRYFNVAGATEAHGEDHNPETHVIPVALEVLAGKREAFTIFGTDYPTDDGTCIRDYVHVVDLADAHIAAIEKLSESSLGAVNLGTRDGFSVKEIVDAVERVTGKKLNVKYGERRPGDPPALIADTTKAQELIGWNPTRSNMDDMIGSAWAWMQAHPDGYED